MKRLPNPDLTVGPGNKPGWNQPQNRRHGFHNVYRLFRRALMLRAHNHLPLKMGEDAALADLPAVAILTGRSSFSALVCARDDRILLARHAGDFPLDQPHSIQSITKLFMHLIACRLIHEGTLNPAATVETYLPDIGSAYRGATVQQVLDMDVLNDFSEDYTDPNAGCYTEEEVLGFRLPPEGRPEPTMHEFITGLTGTGPNNPNATINYLSANTDLLTLICDVLIPGGITPWLSELIDMAGIEAAFHISLSPEGLPALSGGGCLTASDLARFGLMLSRFVAGQGIPQHWVQPVTRACLTRRPAKTLPPPRAHVRYANQMMTDGRWIGHAGYGGQMLMVDMQTGLSCAYLSVIENEAGYCLDYMAETIRCLEQVIEAAQR